MKSRLSIFVLAMVVCALFIAAAGFAQTLEVASTVTVPDAKLDGVGWDGESIWVVTYQSSPIEWRLAKLGPDGAIVSSFVVPVFSRDDVHNLGMTNVTSDGKTLWANDWNAGIDLQLLEGWNGTEEVRRTVPQPAHPRGDHFRRHVPLGAALEQQDPLQAGYRTAMKWQRSPWQSSPSLQTWGWRGTERTSGSATAAPTGSCASPRTACRRAWSRAPSRPATSATWPGTGSTCCWCTSRTTPSTS